jgi:uncharacterized protein YjbI with pentapeptide repeats
VNASNKPTRATPEGNAYLDLQALAKQRGRPVDEYLTLYAANLTGADLTGADLTGVSWSNTTCPNADVQSRQCPRTSAG